MRGECLVRIIHIQTASFLPSSPRLRRDQSRRAPPRVLHLHKSPPPPTSTSTRSPRKPSKRRRSICPQIPEEDRGGAGRGMGNSGSTSPALLGKTHVPDLEWKIHDFSALLETGTLSANSDVFHCSGYKWYLQVTPMHKKPPAGTPHVALCLGLCRSSLEPGGTLNAVFELSIYNHSKGTYCGCKASYKFDIKSTHSNKECLIPLQKLLKSSPFLVDDSCVFGVEILKIDVSSPEEKAIVIQKKGTTVQNLFIQKKGLVKGTYTWTINNFTALELKNNIHSPTFEVGGHKWYLSMYPRGDKSSTDCLSLFLCLDVDASNKLYSESRKVVDMALSILDQKNGKFFTSTQGLVVLAGTYGWGWSNFFALTKLKDISRGYLVGSSCIVKADFTIVGSSNDG